MASAVVCHKEALYHKYMGGATAMIDEQNHLLEAILSELRTVTAELQLLRSELKETSPLRPEEDASSPSYEHKSFAAFDAEEVGDFAVFDWLRTKGISVRNHREQTGADTVLDQCAVFLGDRFATLWRVHDAIRPSLSGEGSFTLNLSSRSQAEIAESHTVLHDAEDLCIIVVL